MLFKTWKCTFLFFCSILSASSEDPCQKYLFSTGIPLGLIDGKCIAITTKILSATTACNSISNNLFSQMSIDNAQENSQIKVWLEEKDVSQAFIGLGKSSSDWVWMNKDTSTYRNWANPPATVPPTSPTTTIPVRSTLPPSQQRRSTAVVVGIDASLFSTNALTFAQVDFARSLSQYIGDRGPAEFAFFAYGCTQLSPYTLQYPYFARNFDDTDKMIANLNETIIHDCVKSNPLDFKSMFRDQTVYYNRYSTSYRPFKSSYISMIYFSSSTNTSNIKSTISLYPIPDSSVITINVGNSSADISPLSIPAYKKYIRVNTPDDIQGLVTQVDAMIFGSSVSGPQTSYQHHNYDTPRNAVTSYTDCAYMNSTNGLWFSDGTCSKRQVLCQYVLPTPPPPPTPNPTIAWEDPCSSTTNNFTYFQVLQNAKCYRLSSGKKQFSEAENVCLTNHPLFLHTPRLTSIETKAEEDQIRTMTSVTNEGMFWFGLRRNVSASPSTWYFVNGDVYDSYSNWRPGYPRDADGCDCVALVINDNSWINTDCNKQLYSICSYRFNTTSS